MRFGTNNALTTENQTAHRAVCGDNRAITLRSSQQGLGCRERFHGSFFGRVHGELWRTSKVRFYRTRPRPLNQSHVIAPSRMTGLKAT